MPSSPNYKRDYKKEAASETSKRKHQRVERVQARREMVKIGKAKTGDGMDVDHKRALSMGGSGLSLSNLRMATPASNRSIKRNSGGHMVSQVSKKERKKK